MRIADINVGYDLGGKLVASYTRWNRRHTTAGGGHLIGRENIDQFVANLRDDGYLGRQVLRMQSHIGSFCAVWTPIPETDLEQLADKYSQNNVEVNLL